MKRILKTVSQYLSSFMPILLLFLLGLGVSLEVERKKSLTFLKIHQHETNYAPRILRDKFGVPHIYGKRNIDVVFGLAYAHAEDDFKTIQDVLFAGRGLLGSKYGPDAAITDYLVHFMDIWPSVRAGYDELPTDVRLIAEAYADGFNLYATEIAAQEPERVYAALYPVTGQDIVAGFAFKTPLFYGFDKTIADLAAGKLLFDKEVVKQSNSERMSGLKLSSSVLKATKSPRLDRGSQGIAIAPKKTEDGSTYLLVNSHQPLTGAVAWYEARLKSEEGLDLVGGTFPGSPLILHGAGTHMGWASTVNKPDLVDIYRLKLNPDNPLEYEVDGAWMTMKNRQVRLKVALVGPYYWTVTKSVKETIFGPVLEFDHGTYAVAYAGYREIRGLEFFLRVNTAKNRRDFENALAMKAMPSINYIYADSAGEIAYYYNAKMPNRPNVSGVQWKDILNGQRSALLWDSYVEANALPRVVNPDSGVVFNANNTPYISSFGQDNPKLVNFPIHFGIETKMTNRALRLQQLLKRPTFIMEDLRDIKYDLNYDPQWDVVQSIWLIKEADLTVSEQKGLTHLKQWNLSTNVENIHAALGVLYISQMVKADMDGVYRPDPTQAFKKAFSLLMKSYKSYAIEYGLLSRIKRGEHSLPLDGGPDVLRAAYGWPLDQENHASIKAGDTYIMFVQWDAQGKVALRTIHNFGSASTRPNSPHYADQMPLFAKKRERVFPFSLDAVESEKTKDYKPGT
ncbi:penicillin acylase family protein [Temperatibacter marinus]|uniref:Penicillin acylase family protein n=1 Tax=Temperatibacter marinus TaxID=1456591 RepID=A0AA52H8N5_9PROT|nr:penicillin acylase family protein [Temperatibacter marinus]WND02301.1 penicillin acylase family protein [Temperatibacter marinus]